MFGLHNKILNIADKASLDSGTSYERYIELFNRQCDKHFGYRPSRRIQKYAMLYGYIPKHQRNKDMLCLHLK